MPSIALLGVTAQMRPPSHSTLRLVFPASANSHSILQTRNLRIHLVYSTPVTPGGTHVLCPLPRENLTRLLHVLYLLVIDCRRTR